MDIRLFGRQRRRRAAHSRAGRPARPGGGSCRGLAAAGRPTVKPVQAKPEKAACLGVAGVVWGPGLTERAGDELASLAHDQNFRRRRVAFSDTSASRLWKVTGSGIAEPETQRNSMIMLRFSLWLVRYAVETAPAPSRSGERKRTRRPAVASLRENCEKDVRLSFGPTVFYGAGSQAMRAYRRERGQDALAPGPSLKASGGGSSGSWIPRLRFSALPAASR